jgi:hypothetical protein
VVLDGVGVVVVDGGTVLETSVIGADVLLHDEHSKHALSLQTSMLFTVLGVK